MRLRLSRSGPAPPRPDWVEQEPLAVAHYHTGAPALTRRPLDAGQVFYLGWYPTRIPAAAFLVHLTAAGPALPPGVLVQRRGRYTIAFNFTDVPIHLTLDAHPVQLAPRDTWVSPLVRP